MSSRSDDIRGYTIISIMDKLVTLYNKLHNEYNKKNYDAFMNIYVTKYKLNTEKNANQFKTVLQNLIQKQSPDLCLKIDSYLQLFNQLQTFDIIHPDYFPIIKYNGLNFNFAGVIADMLIKYKQICYRFNLINTAYPMVYVYQTS